jgi:hypothetical protein
MLKGGHGTCREVGNLAVLTALPVTQLGQTLVEVDQAPTKRLNQLMALIHGEGLAAGPLRGGPGAGRTGSWRPAAGKAV